jgi:hypothetical protein
MDLIISLQRSRLIAMLRGMAHGSGPGDRDAMLLIGLTVGLELARTQPETAANMLLELDPPLAMIDGWLDWVVMGSDVPDPELPIN